MSSKGLRLEGPRYEISIGSQDYPAALRKVRNPPALIYLIGEPAALDEGLAVVGARKATAYGRRAAELFARQAARRGIPVISGGARGCDSCAHAAAVAEAARSVVFLGGGCDFLYPSENAPLFQRIIDAGGAVVSESPWLRPPRPGLFRARNRLIAGMARATLIVEAGLPSGTFSTADEALEAGREVLVVPGSVFSPTSRGSNRLLYQGASPVVDEESFSDVLDELFPEHAGPFAAPSRPAVPFGASSSTPAGLNALERSMLEELLANPLRLEEAAELGFTRGHALREVMSGIGRLESLGLVERYPDGRFGGA